MIFQNKTSALLFLLAYWLLFNFIVLYFPFTLFSAPDVDAITQVEFVADDADSLQLLNSQLKTELSWNQRTLPDDWYKNGQTNRQVWYRAQLNLIDLSEKIWAVYLPSVTHNAAVYVNGIWVGQGGKFSDPVSRYHNEPLLFEFSSSLLHSGSNQIYLRVKAQYHEQGLVDQFYLAPVSQLYDSYYWKKLIRVDFVQWVTIAMYLFSFVVLIFWLARRQDIIYGLFSLELFIWASHNLNLFITNIPVSARIWEAMNMGTLGWTVITMIFFNHRFVGGRNIKVEKIISVFALLGVVIFLLPDIGSVLHIGYRIWDAFVMVFGIYAIYHLLKQFKHSSSLDVYLMLLAGIPILVFGFHDILMINHFIDRRDGLTIQYSVIPSVLLFSWFMVRRFVQSINTAEELADTLELRVKHKQQELQLQYEKLQVLEKDSVLAEERERIMRDMHDGIGGQLVSAIIMLQEQSGDVFNRVREKIQLSLTDLRFVIDSLDPLLNDLPTLLGMMRMRLVDQLEAANIELEWAVTDLPEIKDMSPKKSLHIMRIVQEAITNSIKHSGSNHMKLATGVIDDNVYIDIIDYGLDAFKIKQTNHQGRGIKNMHYRAEQISANLKISKSEEGTSVRLLIK